jgi:hypothetical protein
VKRLATALVIVVFVATSLTLTGCHRLGLVKSAPKHAVSSPATKTGQ